MPFQTESLPLATYLFTLRKLKFLRCQPADNSGRVFFVFDDPEGLGERLQTDFESGGEVPAASYHDSLRHLRRLMDQSKDISSRRTISNEPLTTHR